MTGKEIELIDQYLQENNLCTEENKNALRNRVFHENFYSAILNLKLFGLLTQDYLDIIFSLNKQIHPSLFISIFNKEQLIRLLTLENIESINRTPCEQIEDVLEAFKILKKVDLLTKVNIKIICEHPQPLEITLALKTLKEMGLLTEDNIKIIRDHQYPLEFSFALKKLKEVDLLTKDNIKIIRQCRWPLDIALAFKELKEVNLLKNYNIKKIVLNHTRPLDIASAFKTLNEANILTSHTIKIIRKHSQPLNIAFAFKTFKEANLLTQNNIKILSNHQNILNICSVFKMLKESNLLTLDNMQIICKHQDPYNIDSVFKKLKKTNLLTLDNIKIIYNHRLIGDINSAFRLFEEVNLLTSSNIQSLLNNTIILLPLRLRMNLGNNPRYGYRAVFSMLPNHLITQEVFDNLIQTCHDVQVFKNYIDQLLFRNPIRLPINNPQSTHTASVHQSASASAKNLSESYQDQLKNNENQVISEIEKYINNLGDSLKEKSAKTYIKQVIQGILEFTDPTSGVTLKQLMMLFHLAIHDTKKCTVDPEEGRKNLINALYEIQRGDNLSELGIDDNHKNDKPICISGAFNKLIESLSLIHPDCQMIFMSPETAALKLQSVVKEEALNYLKNNNLEELNEETWVKVIWPKIKKTVAQCLFSEFSGLYGKKGEDDEKFIGLVDSGRDFDFNNLIAAMADNFEPAQVGSVEPKNSSVVNQQSVVNPPSDHLNGTDRC